MTNTTLVGILLLIGWLVFYSRNNGFKIFYPKKASQLYAEWVMIFIITTALALIPFSLSQGYITKWKSAGSLTEANEALAILNKVKVLIPNNNDEYIYNSSYDKAIPIPAEMSLKPDSIDLNLYETQYSYTKGIVIKGYTGASLLFYKDENYKYHMDTYSKGYDSDGSTFFKIREQEEVKDWLRNNEQEKIYDLMQKYESLQKKQKLETIFTPNMWINRIYNPPFFPITHSTKIACYNDGEYEAQFEGDEHSSFATPFLYLLELESGYQQVLKYYNYNDDMLLITLICMCVSLVVSVFVFSFKMTGGKQWLISFIAGGVLLFISGLLAVVLHESLKWRNEEHIIMLILSLWIVLFVSLTSRIVTKVKNKQHKGRSAIYMNLIIWLIPCLLPLLFFIVAAQIEYSSDPSWRLNDDDVSIMFWINIPVSIIAMAIVSKFVRRWKSLAEE